MRILSLVLVCLWAGVPLFAQTAPEDEATIRAAMTAQVDAWNGVDIPGFMQTYEDAADTTFIGLSVRKGYQPILKRYQERYTSREEMGTLSYGDQDIRLLPNGCGKVEIALVTGKLHLEREKRGEAKKDDGCFRWCGARVRRGGELCWIIRAEKLSCQ